MENKNLTHKVIKDIIRIRKEKGISQTELSKQTGLAKSTIARMELGEVNPTLTVLVKILDVLERDIKVVHKKKVNIDG